MHLMNTAGCSKKLCITEIHLYFVHSIRVIHHFSLIPFPLMKVLVSVLVGLVVEPVFQLKHALHIHELRYELAQPLVNLFIRFLRLHSSLVLIKNVIFLLFLFLQSYLEACRDVCHRTQRVLFLKLV